MAHPHVDKLLGIIVLMFTAGFFFWTMGEGENVVGQATKCVDPDNSNYLRTGLTNWDNYYSTIHMQKSKTCSGITCKIDKCRNSNTLLEAYCDGNKIVYDDFYCTCSNGRCI